MGLTVRDLGEIAHVEGEAGAVGFGMEGVAVVEILCGDGEVCPSDFAGGDL